MKKQHAEKCKSRNVVTRIECDCDGYHTFNELYEHRITLFISLCRKMVGNNCQYCDDAFGPTGNPVWKSLKHSDGSSWDGWFIMGIETEPGHQITYHLPMVKWAFTDFAVQLEKAPEFDGHSSDDVLARLQQI